MTFFQKMLDSIFLFSYNEQVSHKLWPHGQSVKTPPFHGGMRGSTPLEATTREGIVKIQFFFLSQLNRESNPWVRGFPENDLSFLGCGSP